MNCDFTFFLFALYITAHLLFSIFFMTYDNIWIKSLSSLANCSPYCMYECSKAMIWESIIVIRHTYATEKALFMERNHNHSKRVTEEKKKREKKQLIYAIRIFTYWVSMVDDDVIVKKLNYCIELGTWCWVCVYCHCHWVALQTLNSNTPWHLTLAPTTTVHTHHYLLPGRPYAFTPFNFIIII